MEFIISSARLYVFMFIACCMWRGAYSYPPSCVTSTPKDIVLLIADSSESGYHGFHGYNLHHGLFYFIKNFIDQCDFTKDRLAIVAFSDTVHYVSLFSNNSNDLQQSLQKWRPEFGGVNTALALRSVQYYLKLNARHHAAQVVVVVTPEHSNNYYDTVSQSQQLRYHHVDIIGVGYGHHRPTKELVAMTGNTHQVFLTSSEEHLPELVPHLKKAICKLALKKAIKKTSIAPITTTTTATTTGPATDTTETTTGTTTMPPTTTDDDDDDDDDDNDDDDDW